MRTLSWEDFSDCIFQIIQATSSKEYSGVYGFPRGGLCLAVTLSHYLKLPFLNKPEPNALIIDDIYETGRTLTTIRDLPGIDAFVWVSKVRPEWWHAVEIMDTNDWVVFPWESPHYASLDKLKYVHSRLLDE